MSVTEREGVQVYIIKFKKKTHYLKTKYVVPTPFCTCSLANHHCEQSYFRTPRTSSGYIKMIYVLDCYMGTVFSRDS